MPLLALVAAVLWNLFIGLFYCWSVFIVPLEEALDVSRASVSAVFSVGIACYAGGMFLSPHLLARVPLPRLAAALGLGAALGLLIAGLGASLGALIAGFGIVFGLTAGAGYALALQAASGELPVRRSFAISITVTAFATAALLWPKPLSLLIAALGPFTTLILYAGAMAGIGLVIALLLRLSGARAPAADDAEATRILHNFLTDRPRVFVLIWLNFVFLAMGGLTALSHAAGIAGAFGVPPDQVYFAPMVTSVGYVAACLCAGPMTDWLTGPARADGPLGRHDGGSAGAVPGPLGLAQPACPGPRGCQLRRDGCGLSGHRRELLQHLGNGPHLRPDYARLRHRRHRRAPHGRCTLRLGRRLPLVAADRGRVRRRRNRCKFGAAAAGPNNRRMIIYPL